ncbi:MAG: right-handed parallel beta-helix repeat-containing protein [Holophagales bacterium]|nr:right-handed parallel beta-helix repeat-containing protein [Holophagales bacterium]
MRDELEECKVMKCRKSELFILSRLFFAILVASAVIFPLTHSAEAGLFGKKDPISEAFTALGLEGRLTDFGFFQRYRMARLPLEKHFDSETLKITDMFGDQRSFVRYTGKPDSRYRGFIPPPLVSIGEKTYLTLAHAFGDAQTGDTIKLEAGSYSLPPIKVAPELEPSPHLDAFTPLWSIDNYAEFYLTRHKTWISFGPLFGVTIQGSEKTGDRVASLRTVLEVKSSDEGVEEQAPQQEEEGNLDDSTSESPQEEPKKKGVLGRFKKKLRTIGTAIARDFKETSRTPGHKVDYPALTYVDYDAIEKAYKLPKVDYATLGDERGSISAGQSRIENLGYGVHPSSYYYPERCDGDLYCADFTNANPLVLDGWRDVVIENVDFPGLEANVVKERPEVLERAPLGAYDYVAPLIYIRDASGITIRGSTFANAPVNSILIVNSKNIRIKDCVFLHNAESAVRIINSEVSIEDSIFLGNGRGKAIAKSHVAKQFAGDEDHKAGFGIGYAHEEYPQSPAIRIESSFLYAKGNLFKRSGTVAISVDCRSDVQLIENVFDEDSAPLRFRTFERAATRIEGNVARDAIDCQDGDGPCQALRGKMIENNIISKDPIPTDMAMSLLQMGSEVESQAYQEAAVRHRSAIASEYEELCSSDSSIDTLEYFLKAGVACLSALQGHVPNFSYFDLSDDVDRSSLAIGYASCWGAKKIAEAGARAARELQAAGYNATLRLYLYKDGLIFDKPVEGFEMELVDAGGVVLREFESSKGKLFEDGAGWANIQFLPAGDYEVRSPFLEGSVPVTLQEGAATTLRLSLK